MEEYAKPRIRRERLSYWKICNWKICNWLSFTRSFLLGPLFFRTALPFSGGYHLERAGMPIHDAVGIKCQKDATTENQGAGVKCFIWAKGCMLMIVCVCYLNWHDYPSLVEGESHGILLLLLLLLLLSLITYFQNMTPYYLGPRTTNKGNQEFPI